MVLVAVRSLLDGAASKKCPAAVSSTVGMGTKMASGYLLDMVCTWDKGLGLRLPVDLLGFHKGLNLVTLGGAYMMLLGALAMAFTKPSRKAEPVPRLGCLAFYGFIDL